MCILCETKYKIDKDGWKHVEYVSNIATYHDDGSVTCEFNYDDEPCGGFAIDNGNELYSRADDPYCGAGPLTINYCPICGKPLVHKEDE